MNQIINNSAERLTTTDEYGHRVFLHPEDVHGVWRKRRTIFYWSLIFFFLIFPWIHFDGNQIVLLNIPKREFIFFGNIFYAHDAPLFVLVLSTFVLSIAVITTIWGRVWCGWACPQTVFIDAIYRRIERMIEGRSRRRQKLDEGPWSIEKIWKKSLKWLLYTIVSLHISHSLLGYFVGTRELFYITLAPPSEHMDLFFTMLFFTGLFLFDFGWFREQFCIIACPYGRLQSVLMDQNSTVVAYDVNRGEPRKHKEVLLENQGDCVDCRACVRACPTGIDIRQGTQLECIACTNCIDACDDIMDRIGKPHGLIRYDSENGLEGRPVKKFGIRSAIYLLILSIVITISIFLFSGSQGIRSQLIRAKTVYTETKLENDIPGVINQYRLTLDYKSDDGRKVILQMKGDSDNPIKLVTPINPYSLKKGHQSLNVFFKFPKALLRIGAYKSMIEIKDMETQKILDTKEVSLVGPVD